MNTRKIGFLINALGSGGAERVVTTLANSLCKNHPIKIITISKKEPFYTLDERIEVIPCFEETNPSKNPLEAIKINFLRIQKIRNILKTNEIDLLIAFMTSANVLATIAARLNGIPVIINERNNPYKDKATHFWKLLRKFTYPLADRLVVQTSTIRGFYAKKIRKNRLHILPNPISSQLTQNRNSSVMKENIILNVGSLTEQKAQHILIEAFALTRADNWKLIIVGEGLMRKKLEKLVQTLGIQQYVSLPGKVKDIHNLYSSSKIFAFSSIYEGFPNALIEAMHFGLASISTDCPTGPSELINNGSNGFLISINDVSEMKEKLKILMHDASLRKRIGQKASASVKKFEINTVALQWEKIITDCLTKRNH